MRDYKHVMIRAQRKRKGLVDEEPLLDKLIGAAFVLWLFLIAALI